jgi:hypothetical protein
MQSKIAAAREKMMAFRTPEEAQAAGEEFNNRDRICLECRGRTVWGAMETRCDQCLSKDPKYASQQIVNQMAEETPVAETRNAKLDFPEDCMYGKMGEWAKAMHVNHGLAYPALLGAYSIKPNYDVMADTRINLYVPLIAKPEGGKNQAIKRALNVVGVTREEAMPTTIGGDAQLASILGDKPVRKKRGEPEGDKRNPGPKKLLIVNNEMGDVLRKTAIKDSTLGPRLCDLWDESYYTKPHERGMITVDCRLSWLGGIPADETEPERFTELMGTETNFGLYPRFIFGYSGAAFNYRKWSNPTSNYGSQSVVVSEDQFDEQAAVFANGGVTLVESFSPEAMAMHEDWNPVVVGVGRLKFNLKKVAVLTASANGERVVGAECMGCAIRFMEWQIEIRKVFVPGEADDRNRQAQFTDRLIRALKDYGADKYEDAGDHRLYKWVSWRRISADRKWGKKIDPSTILRTISDAAKLGIIAYEDPENKEHSKVRLITRRKQ